MNLHKIKNSIVVIVLSVLALIPVSVATAQGASALRITSPESIPQMTVGREVQIVITAAGGTGTYLWDDLSIAVFGSTQELFVQDDQSYRIIGTPQVAGNHTFVVTVRDSDGAAVSKRYNFSVAAAAGNPPGPSGNGNGGGGGQGGGSQGGGQASGSSGEGAYIVGSFTNLTEFQDIPSFLVRLIEVALSVTGILAVLFIIVGGLRMITSAGDSGAVTAGKNTVKYALFGLILAVLSFAIVRVITNVLVS